MSDIKEQAKEQIEKLKQVDWRAKGDEAKAKAETIWARYVAFCGKAYDFLAMIWRGQRTHTPETLKISQKRGTWIVTAFIVLVILGAFMDDEEPTSERASASDAELDNIVSETDDGGIAESSEDGPLVPEKLPGWIKLPKNVDTGLSLRNAGSPNFKPVKGNIYIHIAGLKVGQFDGETAFAHPANDAMSAFANLDAAFSGNVGGISSGNDDHMIAITANDEYASGEQVRPGAYEYVGVDTYKTIFEAKVSLRVFKELPEKKSKEILDAVINNRKLLNAENERREEAMKRRKEAARQRAEAAEQKKRAAYAAKVLPALNIDIEDRIRQRVLVDKDFRQFVKVIKLGKNNERFQKIREAVVKGDWLGVLGKSEYPSPQDIDEFAKNYLVNTYYCTINIEIELNCTFSELEQRGQDFDYHGFYDNDGWEEFSGYCTDIDNRQGESTIILRVPPGFDSLYIYRNTNERHSISSEVERKVGKERGGPNKAYKEECCKRYSAFTQPL